MKFDILDKYNLVNFITDKSVDINYSKQSRDEIRKILQGMSDYQFKKIRKYIRVEIPKKNKKFIEIVRNLERKL